MLLGRPSPASGRRTLAAARRRRRSATSTSVGGPGALHLGDLRPPRVREPIPVRYDFGALSIIACLPAGAALTSHDVQPAALEPEALVTRDGLESVRLPRSARKDSSRTGATMRRLSRGERSARPLRAGWILFFFIEAEKRFRVS